MPAADAEGNSDILIKKFSYKLYEWINTVTVPVSVSEASAHTTLFSPRVFSMISITARVATISKVASAAMVGSK